MTPGHPIPPEWLDAVGHAAADRGVLLIGVRYQDGGRACVPCDLALAADEAVSATVEQRPGCRGLRSFVALWGRDHEPLGAWVVPRSAGPDAERRWRLLLLEVLVLVDRESRENAAK